MFSPWHSSFSIFWLALGFLGVTFGKDFVASAGALAIFTVGQTVSAAAGPAGLLLVMSGHERFAAMGRGAGSVINVLFSFLLIPIWGVRGADMAAALGLVAFNLFALYYIVAKLKVIRITAKLWRRGYDEAEITYR